MSKEGPRRQRTGEIHYLAMHTQMQEKDSDFPGGTKLAMHALDAKESSCRQWGALCGTEDVQRGSQKMSVANLVREDEKENLREKDRDLVVVVLTK